MKAYRVTFDPTNKSFSIAEKEIIREEGDYIFWLDKDGNENHCHSSYYQKTKKEAIAAAMKKTWAEVETQDALIFEMEARRLNLIEDFHKLSKMLTEES
jgi:hypothetical protein